MKRKRREGRLHPALWTFILLAFITAFFAMSEATYATQPPDVVTSDSEGNTAMGTDVLFSLTTGSYNTAAGNQALAQQRRNADASSQMLHQQYLDSSARLNAEHQAGMEQIQRSTDSSMRNANNSMNARTTAASDMQDYSLDRQTVSGANGTYKTSSQYSNVWSSPVGPALSDGRTFGSTDNTVEPNTATDNNWTKDTKVHGNGQPY